MFVGGLGSGGRGAIGRFLSHWRSIRRLGTIVREKTFLPVDLLLGGHVHRLGLTVLDGHLPG